MGVLAADYFIFAPRFAFNLLSPDQAAALAILFLVAALISSITVQLHASRVGGHRQREWLQTTLTSIGDAVIATDTSGRITLINGAAVALTGWSDKEARGQPLTRHEVGG